MKEFLKKNYKYPLAGILLGAVAVALTVLGNPLNMGFCIACFLRDTAGALGLHSAAAVQYARPEVIGIVLGAFIISLFTKEFSPKGGSAPLTRFVLGMTVAIGSLIFLGCPLRMLLRIGGGDLNAVIGLLGFIAGIGAGVIFLNKGFSLKRTYQMPLLEGAIAPASSALLLIAIIAVPSLLIASQTGPGSQHAPLLISLAAGLVIGAVGQRVRLCFAGGFRDAMMFKQFQMIFCFVAVIVSVIIGNLITGNFKLGFEGQNVAHTEFLWNFLGLFLVGIASVFLGGCPFRQLVLAGSGNSDSAITVIGIMAGAAIAHNFGLASSSAGTTLNGRIAFGVCMLIVLAVGFLNTKRAK